jgi:hypothetical protein
MGLKLGTLDVADIKVGANTVSKIFMGDTQIYPSGGTTPFNMSPFPSASCSNTTWTQRYHNGAGAMPVDGNIIYVDEEGTTPYDQGGNQQFSMIDVSTQNSSRQISNVTPTGIVANTQPCP